MVAREAAHARFVRADVEVVRAFAIELSGRPIVAAPLHASHTSYEYLTYALHNVQISRKIQVGDMEYSIPGLPWR